MPDLPDSPEKFQPDFFIRDACRLGFFVIRKIAQMDQQRQYVIPVTESDQVIGETIGIYPDFDAAQKPGDGSGQAVEIQADVSHQAFGGRGLSPIGMKPAVIHGFHYRIGIVDGTCPVQRISVIPLFHFGKITVVFLAELTDFIFCKTYISCKLSGENHRILLKI